MLRNVSPKGLNLDNPECNSGTVKKTLGNAEGVELQYVRFSSSTPSALLNGIFSPRTSYGVIQIQALRAYAT
jgi:hypothetical protein